MNEWNEIGLVHTKIRIQPKQQQKKNDRFPIHVPKTYGVRFYFYYFLILYVMINFVGFVLLSI